MFDAVFHRSDGKPHRLFFAPGRVGEGRGIFLGKGRGMLSRKRAFLRSDFCDKGLKASGKRFVFSDKNPTFATRYYPVRKPVSFWRDKTFCVSVLWFVWMGFDLKDRAAKREKTRRGDDGFPRENPRNRSGERRKKDININNFLRAKTNANHSTVSKKRKSRTRQEE